MNKHYLSRIMNALTKILLLSTLIISSAWAGETQVEIFFLPHRPAVKVADEAEKIAQQFDNVSISRYSFDDAASRPLVEKYGLTEHLPVAIIINGQKQFSVNGKTMSFLNFPKSDTFIPSFAGEWDYADLQALLSDLAQ